MGVTLLPFVPYFCRNSLDNVNVQPDAVYVDLSAIYYAIENRKKVDNPERQTILYLDIIIQKTNCSQPDG